MLEKKIYNAKDVGSQSALLRWEDHLKPSSCSGLGEHRAKRGGKCIVLRRMVCRHEPLG